MPKITGFEMLELIEEHPIIIFTTAYNEYAIKALEMNAVDYLLKPFSKERFKQALEKAFEKFKHKETDQGKIQELINNHLPEKIDRIVVKTGSKIKVIPIQDLIYLEAQDDYVMLYTREGKYLKQHTMKYFEQVLNPSQFIRIHRSYIINLDELGQIEPYEKESHRVVLKNNVPLPVSKTGYSQLKKVLNF
jgi:two-component system, LytTR family, response regulator